MRLVRRERGVLPSFQVRGGGVLRCEPQLCFNGGGDGTTYFKLLTLLVISEDSEDFRCCLDRHNRLEEEVGSRS